MFAFLKPDPVKKLRKIYDKKSTEAMYAQRKGDIRSYSQLTAEAEDLWQQILAFETKTKR
tara:strand:+ start:583 stop:762 length:180 start_codon:yes stop_codon:yes gene_type:complete